LDAGGLGSGFGRVVDRQRRVGLHHPAGVVRTFRGGDSPPARTAVRAGMTALSQDEPRRARFRLLPHHFARPTAQVAGALGPGRFRRRFHRRSCPSRFRSHGNSGIRSFDNRITPALRCDPAGTGDHPKVVQWEIIAPFWDRFGPKRDNSAVFLGELGRSAEAVHSMGSLSANMRAVGSGGIRGANVGALSDGGGKWG
jgi:hypothetical protein